MVIKYSYYLLTGLLFLSGLTALSAQEIVVKQDNAAKKDTLITTKRDTVAQMDVGDLFNLIFRKNRKPDTSSKKSSLLFLPSIGYTPGTGFEFGVDISGSRYFGDAKTTNLSIFDAFAAKSTHELAFLQLKHSIYTKGNEWNIRGTWNFGKTEVLDHGIGSAHDDPGTFPIKYTYLKISENLIRQIFDNFYAGIGFTFNYYTNIDDEKRTSETSRTFNHIYSIKNDYPTYGYSANGLLFNLQYDSRDQPYRPYRGLYVDVMLKTNKKWMGSEHGATQLQTEMRKYWSLSSKNPEHVLAYWLWASYLLKGSLPYLELPATGSDTDQRLGRGYTISRFKGPSFFYNELEYRFPITDNKLISGVAFFNVESASSQKNPNVFQYLQPGGGAGLRILFNKRTRSNLCIDYGVGNYGSNGVFVGLNEVF